jgi:predicted DNA-binding transcriptional regulator AlpA
MAGDGCAMNKTVVLKGPMIGFRYRRPIMSEPAAKNKEPLVVQLTVDELSAIVREAVMHALKAVPRDDELLTIEQVCKKLNVSDEWIYHHVKKLPFVRKVGGMLRFISNGLQRYIESTKFSVKGS